MLIRKRMTRNPLTILPDTPVQEAISRMRKAQVRRFPVVNPSGKIVGIVSERDLLYASPSPATSLSIHEIHYLLSKLKVAEVMKKNVITVGEDTPVEDAARIMADRKIGGLPVVRDGVPVGIITETDLFKLFLELLGARTQGVRLTLLVQDVKGALAKITSAISHKGGNIIALGTFLGDDPSTRTITLRIADVAKDDLVETLTPLVMKVMDARDV